MSAAILRRSFHLVNWHVTRLHNPCVTAHDEPMNNNISAKMEATLISVALAAVTARATAHSEDGEVTQADAVAAGARQPQLDALEHRGILICRRGIATMPNGEPCVCRYYSVA